MEGKHIHTPVKTFERETERSFETNKYTSSTYSSLLIGSEVPVVVFVFICCFFLSAFLCDLPFRRRRKDSLSDFFNDLRLDIGLSSALAISKNGTKTR